MRTTIGRLTFFGREPVYRRPDGRAYLKTSVIMHAPAAQDEYGDWTQVGAPEPIIDQEEEVELIHE